MPTIADYQIDQAIYESEDSLVYRVYRHGTKDPAILKLLKQAYPPPEKIAWFRREYERTQSLALDGVIEAYSLELDQHHWVITLEDFGGQSLDLLMQQHPFRLEEFWPIAIAVVDILGQVHQQQVIHKDINPSNIVFNPITSQLKLIDFGISTTLSRENTTFRNPNMLEGTLAYISPEQTGRMNRAIDYRTDFYSLGVTFYELLTGRLPFQTSDPMELVHSHIARQPLAPHVCDSRIPEPLSQIVLKLMSKNAEDRYQSAYGLKADLEEGWQQWRLSAHVSPFTLGQADVCDKFQLPQKLYGREPEIERLLAAFMRVAHGTAEMMLISGYSGIGKSALVQEIYKPVTQQHGFFASGKFDQLQKDTPYAPFIQAFRSLTRQLLSESEEQIISWRDKIMAAVGTNGQILLDVVPEVEHIIGPQPEVLKLSPEESGNRFNSVLQGFLRVFTSSGPLVIFLDDLQWADNASLQLLKLLITTSDLNCLLIIGAYRDNEVHALHPLLSTRNRIQQEGIHVEELVISPLTLPHITQL